MPGDIIGLVNPGQFAIGDTLHSGAPLRFLDLPRFPAEHFGRVRLQDTRYKQFDEGLRQLEEEGLMQVFYVTAGRREPIVGVVGALQFDVIASRLRTEYGVAVDIEPAGYTVARWLGNPDGADAVASEDRARWPWTGRSGACSCLRRSGSCSTSSAIIPTWRCWPSRRWAADAATGSAVLHCARSSVSIRAQEPTR